MSMISNPISSIMQPSSMIGNTIEDVMAADSSSASFEDILQKQFSIRNENALQSPSGLYGIPTGLDIQELVNEYDAYTESVAPASKIGVQDFNLYQNGSDEQDINTGVTMPDLDLNLEQDKHSQLFKFAQKHAANFYGKCSGNIVLSLDEFVSDAINM